MPQRQPSQAQSQRYGRTQRHVEDEEDEEEVVVQNYDDDEDAGLDGTGSGTVRAPRQCYPISTPGRFWSHSLSHTKAGPEETRDQSGASRAFPGAAAHATPPRRHLEKGDRLAARRVQSRVRRGAEDPPRDVWHGARRAANACCYT